MLLAGDGPEHVRPVIAPKGIRPAGAGSSPSSGPATKPAPRATPAAAESGASSRKPDASARDDRTEEVEHVVAPGQNLTQIAQDYSNAHHSTTLGDLIRVNQSRIVNPDLIEIGQSLTVPLKDTKQTPDASVDKALDDYLGAKAAQHGPRQGGARDPDDVRAVQQDVEQKKQALKDAILNVAKQDDGRTGMPLDTRAGGSAPGLADRHGDRATPANIEATGDRLATRYDNDSARQSAVRSVSTELAGEVRETDARDATRTRIASDAKALREAKDELAAATPAAGARDPDIQADSRGTRELGQRVDRLQARLDESVRTGIRQQMQVDTKGAQDPGALPDLRNASESDVRGAATRLLDGIDASAPGRELATSSANAVVDGAHQRDIRKAVDRALQDARNAPFSNAPTQDAKAVVDRMSASMKSMTPEQKQAFLADPQVQQLVDARVSPAFLQPLKNNDGSGYGINTTERYSTQTQGAAQAADSLGALAEVTTNAPAELTTKLYRTELSTLKSAGFSYRAQENAKGDFDYGLVANNGTQSLATILHRIDGTPEGMAMVNETVREVPFQFQTVQEGELADMADGKAPTITIAYVNEAKAQGIKLSEDMSPEKRLAEAADRCNGNVKKDIEALQKHTEELAYLATNHGGLLTPEQKQQAVQNWLKDQPKEWHDQYDRLVSRLQDDGKQSLEMIADLRTAGGPQGDALAERIENDPSQQYARSLYLTQHPEWVNTEKGVNLKRLLAGSMKVTNELSYKLPKELMNAEVRANLLPKFDAIRPAPGGTVDPAKVAQAKQAVDDFFNDPSKQQWMGLKPGESRYKAWMKVADEIKKQLPEGGATEADLLQKARNANNAIDALEQGATSEKYRVIWDRKTGMGQVMRGISVAAGVTSLVNSSQYWSDGKLDLADGKPLLDATNTSQKIVEILGGAGAVREDSMLGKFGAGNKTLAGESLDAGRLFRMDRSLAYAGAFFDGYMAVRSAQQGDGVSSALYGASAAGGALTAFGSTSLAASMGMGSWAGPVGIAISVAAAAGIMAWQHHKDMSKFEFKEGKNEDVIDFLKVAGLDDRTAQILTDQSGEGRSVVPILVEYANRKGYHLGEANGRQKEFVDWLNGLDDRHLEQIRDQLHLGADEFEGDLTKLGNDPARVYPEDLRSAPVSPMSGVGSMYWVPGAPETMGAIDAVFEHYGEKPLA